MSFFKKLKLRAEILRENRIKTIIFAVVCVAVCVAFILVPINEHRTKTIEERGLTSIRGTSMEPTIKDGEILYIAPLTFERGEIVAARCPRTDKYLATTSTLLLKRIVGLPGEVVEITPEGVFINGELLQEDYVDDITLSYQDTNDYNEIILSDYEYFLLGDNRANSFDSRHVGGVHASYFYYALTRTSNATTMSIRLNELLKFVICASCVIFIPLITFLILTPSPANKTLRNSSNFKNNTKNKKEEPSSFASAKSLFENRSKQELQKKTKMSSKQKSKNKKRKSKNNKKR